MAEANVFFPKDPNKKPFLSYSYGGRKEVRIPTWQELEFNCDTKLPDTADIEVRVFERVTIYRRGVGELFIYVEK